jgi:hypothetical protein
MTFWILSTQGAKEILICPLYIISIKSAVESTGEDFALWPIPPERGVSNAAGQASAAD